MLGSLLILLIATSNVVVAETAICEQFIECLAKARAKNNECLAAHVSSSNPRDSKHECRNETLHHELKQLTEQRTAHYETCLRSKAPSAMPIENAKKKAKCDAIMRKHSVKKDSATGSRKPRRSTKKDKRKEQLAQKSCFREARNIKQKCTELAKCCSISKLCRDTSEIDQQIYNKKMEIKEVQRKCRAENGARKKERKHKRQQQRQQHGAAHSPAAVAGMHNQNHQHQETHRRNKKSSSMMAEHHRSA